MKKKTTILDKEDPVLRKMAKPVPIHKINSKEMRDLIKRMGEAMHEEEDGVAIAAPQVGESLQIFLVNREVLRQNNDSDKKTRLKDLIFINPEIVKLSKKKGEMEEGCLSVRWLYGEVERSEKATVRAYDENGKKFEMGASGLLAQIFQHETDHLKGVLFIDKAKNLRDLPPADTEKHVKKRK